MVHLNLLPRSDPGDDEDDADETTFSDDLSEFEDQFSSALDPTQDEED